MVVWDLFGHLVRFVKTQIQGAGCVLDRGFGRHGTVGDDLRYLACAVLINNILNHLVATPVVEININIRQADAVGIEESLKQQVIGNWVYVGDANAVGNG